jgi:hypothetical protein
MFFIIAVLILIYWLGFAISVYITDRYFSELSSEDKDCFIYCWPIILPLALLFAIIELLCDLFDHIRK